MALVAMQATMPRSLVGGRYRLGERLDSGAAGAVWSARDERVDRLVAVRQLAVPSGPAGARTRCALGDVAREGRVAAELRHPGVAALIDVVEDDATSWLIREYVPGRSLAAAVARRAIDPARVARIGAELADALAAAHAAGLIHCGVRPGNVLLGDDGTVKLADFGLARAVRDAYVTGPGVLPDPAANPAADGPREFDTTTDVHSLAATLDAAVRRGAAARPAGPLAAVLATLLATPPAARPSAARTRDLLATLAEHRPAPRVVVELPAGAPRPARTVTRRRRASLSAVAVLGAGAVASSLGGAHVLPFLASSAPVGVEETVLRGPVPMTAPPVVGAPVVGPGPVAAPRPPSDPTGASAARDTSAAGGSTGSTGSTDDREDETTMTREVSVIDDDRGAIAPDDPAPDRVDDGSPTVAPAVGDRAVGDPEGDGPRDGDRQSGDRQDRDRQDGDREDDRDGEAVGFRPGGPSVLSFAVSPGTGTERVGPHIGLGVGSLSVLTFGRVEDQEVARLVDVGA